MFFVGRTEESRLLLKRLPNDGVTIVLARPLMGKTTLLRHCLYESCKDEPLVGWAESSGEYSDLLLRAIADLYTSWLSNSSYRQQALSLWRRRKGTATEEVARLVSKILESSKLPGAPALANLLGQLAQTNEHLREGIVLPRLAHETATELLEVVRDLSSRRLVIVLDNFERTPNPLQEQSVLTTFIRGNGPRGVHIVILCRDETLAAGLLRELARESPAVKSLVLGPLCLTGGDERRLLNHVRATVPAAAEFADDDLVGLIDGYPGVLYWWFASPEGGSITTAARLVEAAAEAHSNSYRSLGVLLHSLPVEDRMAAARVALLLPLTPGSPRELLGLLETEDLPSAIQRLQAIGVLDPGCAFPSFGHPTRHDAAQGFFLREPALRPALILEARRTIDAIAMKLDIWPSDDTVAGVFVMLLLASLKSVVSSLELAPEYGAACRLADDYLVSPFTPSRVPQMLEQVDICFSRGTAPIAAFVLGGLIGVANLESTRTNQRPILVRSRELLQRFPGPQLRHLVAVAHTIALDYELLHDERASSQEILVWLRRLVDSHPSEPKLLDSLCLALTQVVGRELGDDISSPGLVALPSLGSGSGSTALMRRIHRLSTSLNRDVALQVNEELRRRAIGCLERKAVRDRLLITILRWIRFAPSVDLEREHGELQAVRKACPGSDLVRRCYAEGTYHCLIRDMQEGRFDRRDHWLGLLRETAEAEGHWEEVERWLFLGLMDSAELTAALAKDPEGARPFLREIDDRSRSSPGFRLVSVQLWVGYILAGDIDDPLHGPEHGLRLLKEATSDFSDDAAVTGLATLGIVAALERSTRSRKESGLFEVVMREHRALLKPALEHLMAGGSRRVEKEVRRRLREWSKRQRRGRRRE